MFQIIIQGIKEEKVRKKIFWTLFLLIIYILCRNIPLPFLADSNLHGASASESSLLKLVSLAGGGDITNFSILILGLTPWMTTQIIWKFVSLGLDFEEDKYPKREILGYQLFFTLILAIIQAIFTLSSIRLKQVSFYFFNFKIESWMMVIFIMIAASFFMIALTKKNEEKGVGGMTIFILIGMMQSMANSLVMFPWRQMISEISSYFFFGLALLLILLILFFVVMLERATVNLPLRKTAIDNNFSDRLYLPLKVNITGGMSIMFTLMLFSLPQYIFKGLGYLFPHNIVLGFLTKNWIIDTAFGVIVYILLLIALTIGFAFVNVEPKKLVERLEKGGDFIEYTQPGEDTLKVINSHVFRLSVLNAVFYVIFAGIPLIWGISRPQLTQTVMLPGMIIIYISLIINLSDEVDNLMAKRKYKAIFKESEMWR